MWKQHASLSYFLCTDLSSSPPGPYQQEAYLVRPEDKLKHPPVLPPHLLQVLLNKDTGISVSPSISHEALLGCSEHKINVRFIISVTQRCSQNRTMWCSITCTPSPSRWERTRAFIVKSAINFLFMFLIRGIFIFFFINILHFNSGNRIL